MFCLKTHPGLRVSEIEDISLLFGNNVTSSTDLVIPINDSIIAQNITYLSNIQQQQLQQQFYQQQQQIKQKNFNEQQRPTFYKYRTEAIGIDKLNSKPHSSFLVYFYLIFYKKKIFFILK